VITAVNPNVRDSLQSQIMTRGARVNSGKATILTASDIHAHNSFDQRRAVIPQEKDMQLKGESLSFTFPAASVTKLQLNLA
jgi:alpha-N-arabinofuranosidase